MTPENELLRCAFERKTGLEPATPTLARSCSTNWAIFAICCWIYIEIVISISLAKVGKCPVFWGKVVLYQLSYFRNLFVGYILKSLFQYFLPRSESVRSFGARSCSTNWAIFAKKIIKTTIWNRYSLFCFAVQRYCVFDNLQTFSSKKIRNFYLSFLKCMHYSNNQLFMRIKGWNRFI